MPIFDKLSNLLKSGEDTHSNEAIAKRIAEYNAKFLGSQRQSVNDGYQSFAPNLTRRYRTDDRHEARAMKIVLAADKWAQEIISATREFRKGPGPTDDYNEPIFFSLEDCYKRYLYLGLIREHLAFGLYVQPGLMETVLALCEQHGKSYLKSFIALAECKPLLAYTFDKLIVPLAQGADTDTTSKSYLANMPNFMMDFEMQPSALSDLSDEGILENFNKVARYYQASFLMGFTTSGHLSAILKEPSKAINEFEDGYANTWVSTSLMHALTSIQSNGGYKNMSLDQYPNQGLNIALLSLFCMHQLNSDLGDDGTLTKRYDIKNIAKLPQQAQIVGSQAGSLIFESMI